MKETVSLNPPIDWVPVNQPVTDADGRYQVTLPAQHPTRFYRLSN